MPPPTLPSTLSTTDEKKKSPGFWRIRSKSQGFLTDLTFAVPAVGAELTGLDADGFHQIVEAVEAKRRKVETLTDLLNHFLVILAVGISVVGQDFIGHVFALTLPYNPPRNQIQIRSGAGEIQVGAGEGDRRAGRPYMDFLCAAAVEEIRGFAELCPADDGIVD